jgi:predicted DCC family thiol-disulfide oxidoreductase YuxK
VSARPVVLFDGDCTLCNASVRFIVRRDTRGVFAFRPLQDEVSRRTLAALGHPEPPDSIALLDARGVHFRSDAALAIAARLGFPWNLAAVFRLVPRPLRDAVYDFIARRRHRWFGRPDACALGDRLPEARIWDGSSPVVSN